jgi:8-oxo-dGTP pyrophosphatase MutT (NUDIX family)
VPPEIDGTRAVPSGLSDPCPGDPSLPANMSLRAAAVPYRRTARGLEFLVVRTRSRRAWTFPKGHIEAGESASQAARREAKEEASISGRIDPLPLTRYRYPALKAPGILTEVCVEAYLLEAEETEGGQPSERRRPTWLPPAAAARKLAEGRASTHAREHRRVIREALARLHVSEPET